MERIDVTIYRLGHSFVVAQASNALGTPLVSVATPEHLVAGIEEQLRKLHRPGVWIVIGGRDFETVEDAIEVLRRGYPSGGSPN